MQRRPRSTRFAPESLERRASPSAAGAPAPPAQVVTLPEKSVAAASPFVPLVARTAGTYVAFDKPKDLPPPPPYGPVRIATR
jgi:hypothetical protein